MVTCIAAHILAASQEAQTLHHFAGQGNIAEVRILLEHGTSVHLRDSDGATALHWACDRGSTEMVVHLLQAGSRVSEADDGGMTALHYAAINDHMAVRRPDCMHVGAVSSLPVLRALECLVVPHMCCQWAQFRKFPFLEGVD
jgi:ankyrin repeat protein